MSGKLLQDHLSLRELQIEFISEKLIQEYGKEMFIIEALENCLYKLKVKI